MVPEGWKLGTLAKLITSLSAGVSVNSTDRHPNDTEYAVLKTSCVSGDKFDPKQRKAVVLTEEIDRLKEPLKGDSIIISRMNTPSLVGANAYIPYPLDKTYLPDRLWQVNVKNEMVNMRWLSIWFSSSHIRFLLSNLATGTSGSMKNITKGDVLALKILIPPLTEQIKIAEILSTYDKAITTTEKLLANSEQQKKALMQQLLTGKKRLSGFHEEFKRFYFSDLLKIDTKSLGNSTPEDFEFEYISLSDVETGRIASKLARHQFKDAPSRARRILAEGDILLATVRPNLKGFVKIGKEHSECIASTGFSVLSQKKNVCGDYVYHYLFSTHMSAQVNALVVGTNYPAINSSDVASLTIYCPEYTEQKKIAAVLNNCDLTISKLINNLNCLKNEKKALMQQLLTGKRRVQLN